MNERVTRTPVVVAGLLLAVAGFLFAIWITWPLATLLTTHGPGPSSDTLLHYWNAWWVRHSLFAGDMPYYTDYLFFPEGISLVTHNIPWFHSIPTAVLTPLFGRAAAYNVALLGQLAACFMAVALLVQRLTNRWSAAVVAGVIYTAWPFRLSQLDHPNMIATYFVPLAFLFLHGVIYDDKETGLRRSAVLAGIFLALSGYARWQHLIAVGPMVVAFVLPAKPRGWVRWETGLRPLLVTAVTALILLAPPLGLLAAELSGDLDADGLLRPGETTTMQTDLAAYTTPPRDHALWGDAFTADYERFYPQRSDTRRFAVYVGVFAAALAVVGAAVWRRRAVPWVGMACLLVVLAAGPVVRFRGDLYPDWWTPYRLLEPMVDLMRVPDRFNIYLALPVAVLAGAGWAYVVTRFDPWPGAARVSTAVVVGLILLDYAVVVPLQPLTARSPYWTQPQPIQATGAILNLPLTEFEAKKYMFDQTWHRRPILVGSPSRIPPGAWQTIDGDPLLQAWHAFGETPHAVADVGAQMARLAQMGVGRIAIHKPLMTAEQVTRRQRYLLARPVYEDDTLAVYTTTPAWMIAYAAERMVAPNVAVLDVLSARRCVRPGQTFEVDIGWGGPEAVAGRTAVFSVGAGGPAWGEGPVSFNRLGWGRYRLQVPDDVAMGAGRPLRVRIDGGEPVTVGTVTVQDRPCRLVEEAGGTAVGADFGEQMVLAAYDLNRDGDRLALRLVWLAQQRMDTAYKVFIHVYDPATGRPVAQTDREPQWGVYPTRFWWPGDVVADLAEVDLSGVPAGAYGLAVGVYDPATDRRLVVGTIDIPSGAGTASGDGRLLLPQTIQIAR